MAPDLVLDTSLLLGGKEPPRTGAWWTTPEAAAEVSPGGRDARRFAFWLETGLGLQAASAAALARVQAAAKAAGTTARLSAPDCSLAGLALDRNAVLVTDDYTLLDLAKRLGITTQTVNQAGITEQKTWRPRCLGCGRWFDADYTRADCTVCGSEVKAKPAKVQRR